MSSGDPSPLERRLRPDEPEAYPWDDRDADELDGPEPGEECGRWWGGRLGRSCTRAGSEECDFECPYRDGLHD